MAEAETKKRIPLHWQIIIGLIAGIIFALLSSVFGWKTFTLNWIAPFGTIFINLLKMIAVPMVLFSIIKGISGLSDVSRLGRVGAKTLGFYMLTTVTAVFVGLILVNTIKPGNLVSEEQRIENRRAYENWVANTEGVEVLDGQSVEDDAAGVQDKMASAESMKEQGPLQFIVDMVPDNVFGALSDNGLMLQIIFFAIFFGITMLYIPKDVGKPVSDVVDGLNEIFLKMVNTVMRAAPLFVFALLAGTITEIAGDDINSVLEVFRGLASYAITLLIGLAFLVFVLYPIIIKLVAGKSYSTFFKSMSPAQILAFTTSSSVATLPVTMECVNERMGVSKEITSFVLPVGATVNMDGTSLYQAVAVVFLAQFHMVDLTIGQQLTIVLTATLASIGAAAVPSAGLIMMILVLGSVGLNPAWIAIIFPIDRPLDMCRTVVNVTGDSTVATLVAKTEGEDLSVNVVEMGDKYYDLVGGEK